MRADGCDVPVTTLRDGCIESDGCLGRTCDYDLMQLTPPPAPELIVAMKRQPPPARSDELQSGSSLGLNVFLPQKCEDYSPLGFSAPYGVTWMGTTDLHT